MVDRSLPPLDDLEAALVDLGLHVDHPRGADLSHVVMARLTEPEERMAGLRWSPFAVAAGLLLVALVALPAPREALADWLGIGAVRVVRTDQLPERVGTELRLGHAVTLEEARSRAPFTILAPSAVGPPSALYAGEPSDDAITLVWEPSDALPATDAGVGLLLTEMPGSADRARVEKNLGPETSLEVITFRGRSAFWITGGPHQLLYLDPEGRTRQDTTRLAANTLLWEVDGVTFRLESRLDRDASVDLARNLEPVG